jgi:hypothetical protein
MATVIQDNRSLDERQADWLHNLPDKFIPCRGDHHDWPVLKPGKLPRGIRAIPLHDGSFEMTAICRNCGRERTKTTLPRGVYDRDAKYVYRDPEGYKAPPGLGLSRQDYIAELYRRVAESLVTGDVTALADLQPRFSGGEAS